MNVCAMMRVCRAARRYCQRAGCGAASRCESAGQSHAAVLAPPDISSRRRLTLRAWRRGGAGARAAVAGARQWVPASAPSRSDESVVHPRFACARGLSVAAAHVSVRAFAAGLKAPWHSGPALQRCTDGGTLVPAAPRLTRPGVLQAKAGGSLGRASKPRIIRLRLLVAVCHILTVVLDFGALGA